MQQPPRLRGVLAPVVTPFTRDLSPDPERFIAHCRWLLGQNCGLAVFGTNSEANSLSVDERIALLEALLAADLDPARIMPGTGCCALTDAVRLTEHAVKAGCAGVLMLPPFYYKDVSEDGLYRHFAEVVERVGDARLRIYLYHIPPVAVVGITPTLVERLMQRYPSAIAGMKDSSGDWHHTKTMLDAFAASGFDVFPGSEPFLLAGMRHGAAGCISATANVNPAAIDRLYREWRSADADLQQEALNAVRKTVGQYVMIPALKQVIAHYADDPAWVTVRPPLTALTAAQAQRVIAGLKQLGFHMPGIGRAAAKSAV
ncbi:MAG: dihydrodipicolinate synthase family protein [Candidatus Entotheonellia bacterium]